MYEQKIKAALDAADAVRSEDAKPLRILLVDADARFRESLASKLRDKGHSVTCFTNCYDAWMRARSAIFDLTLIDIELPAMTGLELARRIKNRQKQAMIVATSPNATSKSVLANSLCQANGIAHLLGKSEGPLNVFSNLCEIISPPSAVAGPDVPAVTEAMAATSPN